MPTPKTTQSCRGADTAVSSRFWTPGLVAFLLAWAIGFCYLVPNPLELVQHNWPFAVVGFCGAVIGNVTALGGGLVFIPVLVFLWHVNPVSALKTSILTQTFGMSSGAIAWNKNGKLPWHMVPWAVPGLLLGATISSLVIHPNAALIKGLFGPVSITLGAFLLFTLRKQVQAVAQWNTKTKLAVIAGSFVGGLITGWVAIGEGEVVAAVLMLFFGFAAEVAIPLGVCLLAISSFYLAIIHSTILGGVPWEIVAFTVPAAVLGARLAPRLAGYCNPRLLKAVFAVVAILDGCLFLYQWFMWAH